MKAQKILEYLLRALVSESKKEWGSELRGILLFGSLTTQLKHTTDIDCMVCIKNLPKKRRERLSLFDPVEARLSPYIKNLRKLNYHLEFSPLLRTLEELQKFSSLYLDLPERHQILYDPDGIFSHIIQKTKKWIQDSGARKVVRGLRWYWILKPGATTEDTFEMGWK